MQLIINQPDESIPLARAEIEVPRKRDRKKRGRNPWDYLFEADRALRARNIMRITPWRNGKYNPFYYVCEVKLDD